MTYDKDLSVGLNIELNHVPTVLEQLRDVWEEYDCDMYDQYCNGWFSAKKDNELFRFFIEQKEWYAYDNDDVLRITVKHMDMIDETGQILGWW